MFHPPHPESYRDQLRAFLREDWGTQDWTTASVPDRPMRARIRAKSPLVLSGLPIAAELVHIVAPSIGVAPMAKDGDRVAPGTDVLVLKGSSHAILLAERVMLNLLQRMSGTATLTRAFVDAVAGTKARVLDTRKTTPGLKLLEKYAVRCGGGVNHRMGLGDGVLIKENHIAAAGSIAQAVEAARRAAPNLVRIEVEVERLDQLLQCLALADVDGVLLDNMDLDTMRQAVKLRDESHRTLFLEASGNMTIERARPVAETGVDFLSVGALTHSAPAADLSLRLD
ncbi:MAG TPA: carboxylating nicotinate-nucleotide diphosphorylase [Holophagaceae bacterium]|nr:carboxylating nicotinate-nucleotide diphosphorylase [Holophagaceae bacterium]